MKSRYRLILTAVAASLLASAMEGAAQVCIGMPAARGQAAAAVTATFPAGANELGAEAGYHTHPGLAVFGGFNLYRPDEGDNVTSLGVGAAYSLPELRAALPANIYSCPVASLAWARGGGDSAADVVSVPMGIGFATILPIGTTMTLSPYVIPELRLRFVDGDRSANRSVSAGAILLGFLGPRPYAGVTMNRVFIEGGESVLGLKVGLVF
jgi:hypothetical protein